MIGLDRRPLSEDEVRRARHGYYAAVSYLDERVGEVLDALAATGLDRRHARRLHGRPRRAAGRARALVQDVVPRGLRARAADRARPGPRAAARARGRSRSSTSPPRSPSWRGAPAAGGGVRGHEPRRGARRDRAGARRRRWASTWPRASGRPPVMIRRGAHKYVRCPGDPDLLYDLAADPLELRNLAGDPGSAGLVAAFRAESDERWDLGELERRVLESQRARHLVARALAARRLRALGLPALLRRVAPVRAQRRRARRAAGAIAARRAAYRHRTAPDLDERRVRSYKRDAL